MLRKKPGLESADAGTSPRAEREAKARPRRDGSDLPAVVLACVAIALPLAYSLHQHVRILRFGYEIEALQERRTELEERARELRAERLGAASLQAAQERSRALGLAVPGPGDVYHASAARDARLPEAAGGAAGPRSIARLE